MEQGAVAPTAARWAVGPPASCSPTDCHQTYALSRAGLIGRFGLIYGLSGHISPHKADRRTAAGRQLATMFGRDLLLQHRFIPSPAMSAFMAADCARVCATGGVPWPAEPGYRAIPGLSVCPAGVWSASFRSRSRCKRTASSVLSDVGAGWRCVYCCAFCFLFDPLRSREPEGLKWRP